MPDFELNPSTYTIADYCRSIERREVVVNREYQRSDKVWPLAAQSFLVESILLGYPIPKLSLHQVTDIKTRRSLREIVDGQQRTKAIKSFFDNQLRLSRTLDLDDAAGKMYNELSEILQHKFLDYSISVDVFTGASSDAIREVFRRINSYTVPLNPEEQRHATYQGDMKWFIYRLCRDFDAYMIGLGTFSEGRLVRMQDAKLYAEVVHALVHGIQTTKRQNLDRLYEEFDKKFTQNGEFEKLFRSSMEVILQLDDLHRGPLMKPHMIYSLILAVMAFLRPIDSLMSLAPRSDASNHINVNRALPALSMLANAVDVDDPPNRLSGFVTASGSRTNVKNQREIRFTWLYNALHGRVGVGQ